MEAILGIACLAAIINLLYKHGNVIQNTGGRNGMDFTDVSEQIDRVNEIRERLGTIEEENILSHISTAGKMEYPEQRQYCYQTRQQQIVWYGLVYLLSE